MLSVEPYGMKLSLYEHTRLPKIILSVLSVEPYGMKQIEHSKRVILITDFQCSRSSRMG